MSYGTRETLNSDIKQALANKRKIMNRSILSWQKGADFNTPGLAKPLLADTLRCD